MFELIFLFTAGLFGGILNSIAGGGSFITFPALLFVGVAPLSANATNTFASCAGYLSGTYGFREELSAYKKTLPTIILISLIGGTIGAWLLMHTPESQFREAIPWLLLFATVLFIFGEKINSSLKNKASQGSHAKQVGQMLLLLLLLGICIYGGFFNAGLGIIALSYLALAGYTNINAMNGLKLLISTCVSITAILLFIFDDMIAWYQGAIVMLGTLVGGYLAAHISKQVPQHYVRWFVIFASCGLTVYFFILTYIK